jgi:hypothetical protein
MEITSKEKISNELQRNLTESLNNTKEKQLKLT